MAQSVTLDWPADTATIEAGTKVKVSVSGFSADATIDFYAGSDETGEPLGSKTLGGSSGTFWIGPVEVKGTGLSIFAENTATDPDEEATTGNTFDVTAANAYEYSITSTTGPVTAGSSLDVTVQVLDEYGNKVDSYDTAETLTIYSSKDGEVGSVEVASTDWTSGTPGQTTIITDTGTDGLTTATDYGTVTDHEVTVSGSQKTSAASSVVVNAKTPASLSVTAPETAPTIDAGFNLGVSLFDEYGNPVSLASVTNLEVWSDVDGDLANSGVSGLDSETYGEGTISVTAGELTTAGSHTISVDFDEAKQAASTTLTAEKKASDLSGADVTESTITNPITVSADLVDDGDSSNINGETVVLDPSWAASVEEETSSGSVSHEFDNPGTAGTYYVDLSWSGNSEYKSDTGEIKVTVAQTETSLNITSVAGGSDPVAGESFDVTVKLEAYDGSWGNLQDGNVDVTYNGTTKTAGPTDSSGNATVSFTAQTTTDDYDLSAEFAEATIDGVDYGASSAESTVSVVADTVADFTIDSVTPSTLVWGESVEVAIAPVDQYDNPATNRTVNINLFSTPDGVLAEETGVAINEDGLATISTSSIATVDDSYELNVQVELVDTKTTTLDVNKREVMIQSLDTVGGDTTFDSGDTFDATAALYDQFAESTTAAIITFNFADQGPEDGSDADPSVTSGDTFTAPDTAGTYALTADFSGNSDYKAADQQSLDIVVEPGAVASIEVAPASDSENVETGTSADLVITGYDANGVLASSKNIDDLKIVSEYDGNVFGGADGAPLGLDENGQATITTDALTTVAPNHKLSAYSASGAFSSAETTVAVKKSATLTIVGTTDPFQLAGDIVVEVSLENTSTDPNTALEKDVTVKLYKEYDDTTGDVTETLFEEATVTTDSDGLAEVTFQAPEKVGFDVENDRAINYDLVAEFAGDSEYLETETSASSISPVSTDTGFDTDLLQGWNLMSVTFQPATDINQAAAPDYLPDTAVSEVFGTDDLSGAVFYWDGSGYVSGEDAGPIDPGKGYWIYMAEDYEPYPFSDGGEAGATTGRPVQGDVAISLPNSGWHMISSPFTVGWGNVKVSDGEMVKTVSEAQNAGWMSKWLWAYDMETGEYVGQEAPSGTIFGDTGYWIRTDEPGLELEFPYSPGSTPTSVGSLSAAGFEPAPAGVSTPPAPPAAQGASSDLKANAAVSSEGVTFEVAGADVDSINVQVFSANGAEVFSESASGNTLSWNAEVANGVYLYGVSAEVNGSLRPLGIQKLLILQ